MRTRVSMAIFAVTALLFVLSPTLQADSITLTLSNVSGSPGSKVHVMGTIINTSGGTIYLNGTSFSLSGPISLTDTNFFLNAPLSIASGASSGPFDIFTVGIGLSASSGILGPNFFAILGGATQTSSDFLGEARFNVNVTSTTPVPEPASSTLVISGLLLLVIAGSLGLSKCKSCRQHS